MFEVRNNEASPQRAIFSVHDMRRASFAAYLHGRMVVGWWVVHIKTISSQEFLKRVAGVLSIPHPIYVVIMPEDIFAFFFIWRTLRGDSLVDRMLLIKSNFGHSLGAVNMQVCSVQQWRNLSAFARKICFFAWEVLDPRQLHSGLWLNSSEATVSIRVYRMYTVCT